MVFPPNDLPTSNSIPKHFKSKVSNCKQFYSLLNGHPQKPMATFRYHVGFDDIYHANSILTFIFLLQFFSHLKLSTMKTPSSPAVCACILFLLQKYSLEKLFLAEVSIGLFFVPVISSLLFAYGQPQVSIFKFIQC